MRVRMQCHVRVRMQCHVRVRMQCHVRVRMQCHVRVRMQCHVRERMQCCVCVRTQCLVHRMGAAGDVRCAGVVSDPLRIPNLLISFHACLRPHFRGCNVNSFSVYGERAHHTDSVEHVPIASHTALWLLPHTHGFCRLATTLPRTGSGLAAARPSTSAGAASASNSR